MSDADRADGFRGLAHPVRRKVIRLLGRDGESAVSQLLGKIDATPQAMSAHLAILRETGLVNHRVVGASRLYTLSPAALKRLARWIEQSI